MKRHWFRLIDRRRSIALLLALAMAVSSCLPLTSAANEAGGEAPSCGLAEHVHSGDCYGEGGEIICGITEHVHTSDCYAGGAGSDPSSDSAGSDPASGGHTHDGDSGHTHESDGGSSGGGSAEQSSTPAETPQEGAPLDETPEQEDEHLVDLVKEELPDKEEIEAVNVMGEAALSKGDAAAALSFETDLTLDEIDEVVEELFETKAAFAAALRSLAPDPEIPRQGDGSNIEGISAKWITEDTIDNGDDSLLYLKPADDSSQMIRLQINYALSGEHNYEPGDVTITVPAYIFDTREGKDTGNLIIPYGEEPSKKGDFNWKRVGDTYVLTNTRKMSAATKGYIQFAFADLVPHTIVDSKISEDFTAYIEVVTHRGNVIGLESNAINAMIDTEAKVTNAYKRASAAQRVSYTQIPEGQRVTGEEEYIVVDWTVWGYVVGNTVYDLKIIDMAADEYSGFMISPDSGERLVKTIDVNDSYRTGTTSTYSYRTAYPASQFEPDTEYIFHNNVEFILTEEDPEIGSDPQLVTVQTAGAQRSYIYHLPQWVDPYGHFMVWKNGNDDEIGTYLTHKSGSVRTDRELRENGWYGIYNKALNDLHAGAPVQEIAYTVNTIGYMMPWTYEPDGTEMSARKLSNYGRHYVTMTTTDTGMRIVGYGGLTVFEDYEFTAVEFPYRPVIYSAVPQNINPDGSWAAIHAGDGTFRYTEDRDDSHIPDVTLELKINGEWIPYATCSYTTGSPVITKTDGTVVSGIRLDLPENVETFRTKVTTNIAGMSYDVRPIVEIKNTERLYAAIDDAFERYLTPELNVYNSTNMTAVVQDVDPDTNIVDLNKDGYDKLRGYSTEIMATPSKTSNQNLQKDVDFDNRVVTIHYSASVKERSFISDRQSYDEAVEDGKIIPETKGVWRDLLPKGVTPIISSVKLRDRDSITSVYTIENYQGSGRTLLVVEADLVPTLTRVRSGDTYYYQDEITIRFDALYDFDSILDYGQDIHNVISFESGNDAIGTMDNYSGEPDDPYSSNNIATEGAFADDAERDVMSDLDPDRDTPSFLYAGTYTTIDILSAARTSLSKDVQTNFDGRWSDGTYYDDPEGNKRTVYTDGFYQYRLRMMSDTETISKNLRLYDSLENFYAGDGNDEIDIDAPRWQGEFLGVDVSQLVSKGCAPVVYYSLIEGLQLSDETDPKVANHTNTDLTNTDIWVRADSYTGELSAVKAIAIDASKKLDGSEFILEPLDSVTALVNMHAPDAEAAAGYIAQDAHAYNNAYLLCTSVDVDTENEDSDNFVRKDYTKVGLEEYKITVRKVWDDGDDRDGKRPEEVTVRLFADGADTGRTLTLTGMEEEGAEFNHLPYCTPEGKKIIYSIREETVAGYRPSISISGLNYTIRNIHEPEKTSVSGKKKWVGDTEAVRPDYIVVELYADGVYQTAKTVRRANDGSWSYSFTDLYKYENGTEIVYTVKERFDTASGISSYIPSIEGTDITNTYHPFGDLTIRKDIQNATELAAAKSFTFIIELTDANGEPIDGTYTYVVTDEEGTEVRRGEIVAGGELTLMGGEKATILELPEKTNYVVTEKAEEGFEATSIRNSRGAVIPNIEVMVAYTNTYSTEGNINLEAEKMLFNRELNRYQFIFELYDEEGDLIKTVNNGTPESPVLREDGTVESSTAKAVFGALRYTEADDGSTFVYTMKERHRGKNGYIYDETAYTIYVTPVDNGDGTMTVTARYEKEGEEVSSAVFENTYEARGQHVLRAWKSLAVRTLEDDVFDFELLDEEGNVLQTKKNKADGSIVFDPISYTEQDIGKTFYYAIREKAGDDATVIYDSTSYGYYVTVLDNGDGTLSFTQGMATPVWTPISNPDAIKYAVSILGIGVDKDVDGNTMGITFGPATGNNYFNSNPSNFNPGYQAHTVAEPGVDNTITDDPGMTVRGNAYRCVHYDTWQEILYWNSQDPHVYDRCVGNSCTHTVELTPTPFLYRGSAFKGDGDGVSALYTELKQDWSRWSRPDRSTTIGGWGASRVRAMLNGADELTQEATAGSDAVLLGEEDALISWFPQELQDAVGVRGTKYDSVCGARTIENLKVAPDKLWLLSTNEVREAPDGYYSHPLEGPVYPRFLLNADKPLSSFARGFRAERDNRGTSTDWWTRSTYGDQVNYGSSRALIIGSSITLFMSEYSCGISPCFALRADTSDVKVPMEITGWETEDAELPVFKNTLKDGSLSLTKYTENAGSADPDQTFRFRIRLLGEEIAGKTFGLDLQKPHQEACEACAGTGLTTVACPECGGTGQVAKEEASETYVTEQDLTFVQMNDYDVDHDHLAEKRFVYFGVLPAPPQPLVFGLQSDDYDSGRAVMYFAEDRSIAKVEISDGTSTLKIRYESGTLSITQEGSTVIPPDEEESLKQELLMAVGYDQSGWVAAFNDYSAAWQVLEAVLKVLPESFVNDVWPEFHQTETTTVMADCETCGGTGQTEGLCGTCEGDGIVTTGAMDSIEIPTGSLTVLGEGEYEVLLHGDETFRITDIPAGTAYQIWEETPDGWILAEQRNASGLIMPLEEARAEFTNRYQPGTTSVQLYGTKLLDLAPAEVDSFAFELLENGIVIQTKDVLDGGFIQFDVINYTQEDVGTHIYTIREIDPRSSKIDYDRHEETVTVVVSDDGAGNLHAEVTYDEDGARFENKTRPGSLEITKSVNYSTEANKDDEFTFKVTLSNEKGIPLSDGEDIYWYTKDADGNVIQNSRMLFNMLRDRTENMPGTDASPDDAAGPQGAAADPETTEQARGLFGFIGHVAETLKEGIFGMPVYAADSDIASGNWDGVDWRITADGELILGKRGVRQENTTNPASRTGEDYPWSENRMQITRVTVLGPVMVSGPMSYMFSGMSYTSTIDVSKLDTSQATTMNHMFTTLGSNAKVECLDVSGFDTSKVTNMSNMFSHSGIHEIRGLEVFDTSQVTDMSNMFRQMYHKKGTIFDVSHFDTHNVKNFDGTFAICRNKNLDVSNFDTSRAEIMTSMFTYCETEVLDVSNFDMTKCSRFTSMFDYNEELHTLITGPKFKWNSMSNERPEFTSRFYSEWIRDDGAYGPFQSSRIGSYYDRGTMYGTWHAVRKPIAVFDSKDGSLKFYNATTAATYEPTSTQTVYPFDPDANYITTSGLPWIVKRTEIRSVVIVDEGIAPLYTCSWFMDCLAQSYDLSKLDTSRLISAKNMFNGAWASSLDLSGLSFESATDLSQMFYGCYIEELDISALSSQDANMYRFFQSSRIRKVTLGPDFSFKGSGTDADDWTVLTTPSNRYYYTGSWVKEDGSAGPMTAAELRDLWENNKDEWAGTWVCEPNASSAFVYLDAQGGYLSTVRYEQQNTNPIELPLPVRYRYVFEGWNTKADGSGTSYAAGDEFTPTLGKAVTLYALWTPDTRNEYRVKHYQQTEDLSGYSLADTDQLLANAGESVTPDVKAYTHFLLPDAQTETVPADDSLEISYYYDRKQYTIRFDGNGATSGQMDDQQLVSGVQVPINKNAFSKTGAIFTGWMDDEGNTYTNGQQIMPSLPDGAVINLRAQWLTNDQAAEPSYGVIYVKCKAGETVVIPDLPAGTNYVIEEVDNPAGWQTGTITNESGTIQANATAQSQVNNRYVAEGVIALEAHKRLVGDELAADQFTFELLDSNMRVLQRITNGPLDTEETVADENGDEIVNPWKGTGLVLFDVLEFSEFSIGRTYTYYIRESAGSDPEVLYDSHTERVRVTVTDAGSGTLNVTAEYDADGALFTNHLQEGTVSLSKTAENATEAAADTDFHFTVALRDAAGNDLEGTYPVKIKGRDYGTEISGAEGVAYSHMSNVDDEGNQLSDYAHRADWNHVVTIEGAKRLRVRIVYGGESANFDWVCMWAGAHPTYKASSYASSLTGKLGGGSHTAASNTKEYDVAGDSVTFAFRSDGSGVGDGYGYYAVVTAYPVEEEIGITMTEVASGGTITLKAGESAEIVGLPDGAVYEIIETDVPGWTNTEKTGETGTVAAGSTKEASFTNRYETGGSARITANKALLGETLEDDVYSFILQDEEGNVLSTAYAKADGTITFDPIVYTQEDDGATFRYFITEEAGERTDMAYDSRTLGVTVSVADNGEGELIATIVYDEEENTFTNIEFGEISIEKQITGSMGNKNDTFGFTLHLSGDYDKHPVTYVKEKADGTKESGSADLTGGSYSFTLGHGERMTFSGIVDGTTYDIVENDANTDGYATTAEGEGSAISTDTIDKEVHARGTLDDSVEVTFTNDRDTAVPTSVKGVRSLRLLLLVLAALGTGIVVIIKRKRS